MHVSDGIAELRVRHALVTERIDELGSNPPTPTGPGEDHNSRPPADLVATARELWDAKLVQIHSAALLDGLELYPLDDDGRCSSCGLHVPTLQQMQPHGLAHQPS
jgi:hypothetical protein